MVLNPSMAKLVTFLTGSVAHRARNIELERPDESIVLGGGAYIRPCTETPPFSLCTFSLSLSVSTAPNATIAAALSIALWRVSIGRDRRNLISMKRALGDFIRGDELSGPRSRGQDVPSIDYPTNILFPEIPPSVVGRPMKNCQLLPIF